MTLDAAVGRLAVDVFAHHRTPVATVPLAGVATVVVVNGHRFDFFTSEGPISEIERDVIAELAIPSNLADPVAGYNPHVD